MQINIATLNGIYSDHSLCFPVLVAESSVSPDIS